MKYWVLSPNVWNDNTEGDWKSAVKSTHHAYIGYEEEKRLGNTFKNEINVGDLLLIAQGANANKYTYLCGIVDGEARREHKKILLV